jgi:hypothetical protein
MLCRASILVTAEIAPPCTCNGKAPCHVSCRQVWNNSKLPQTLHVWLCSFVGSLLSRCKHSQLSLKTRGEGGCKGRGVKGAGSRLGNRKAALEEGLLGGREHSPSCPSCSVL